MSRWLALVAASMGMFLGALDLTVNVALPDISANLDTDFSTVQWIIVLYVGGSTSLQLALGSAADVYGLKRLYIIGLGAYTLAVLLIGLAPTLPVVLGLRLLQAVGNVLIVASVPALVTAIFPSEQRGTALGVMSGISTLGMIIATLGGGVLVDAFGWRSIFLARVPLALITIWLAFTLIREPSAFGGGTSQRFDLRGGVLSLLGMGTLVMFMMLGGRIGWLSPATVALGAVAALSVTLLLRWEREATHPVIDPSLLRHRLIAPVSAALFLLFMATFVSLFILPFYVSDVMGVNAKTLGFLLMLSPGVSAIIAVVGGWLSDRMPAAYLTTAALGLAAAALFSFSTLGASSSVADVAWRMALSGVGIGLFQAASATLIMGAMPADRLGSGGSLLAIAKSLGTVSSVALISPFFDARLEAHATAVDPTTAFVQAFGETYILAGVLAALGIAISLTYWPQLLRRTRHSPDQQRS